MERIGLLAGAGKLPIIFAKEARKKGIKVIGFAIKEMASPDFDACCDRTHRLSTKQIKKFLLLLVAERIRKIVMLGKVDKSILYEDMEKDENPLNEFKDFGNKSDYAILDRVTSEFEKRGVKVVDASLSLSELLPGKGVLTKRKPLEKEEHDISFGLKVAKELAKFDVGQAIVIKDRSVVSVEAMEGTDNTIKRAAPICGEGFTVVKISRPEQDMRWDVPVVGPQTVRLIAELKGKVLAIEEKRMFLVEKDLSVKIANENDISIVVV